MTARYQVGHARLDRLNRSRFSSVGLVWRLMVIGAAAVVIAGCGSKGSPAPKRTPVPKPSPAPKRSPARVTSLAGGCGSTRVDRGVPPGWTAPAFADSSGMANVLPYALGARGTAAAMLFGYPLRAGNPSDPANKILWIMRLPRNGSGLVIRVKPLHADRPVITVRRSADSGPGEIYPSYVNVPTAGCWRLSLRWARHTDSIDLLYKA